MVLSSPTVSKPNGNVHKREEEICGSSNFFYGSSRETLLLGSVVFKSVAPMMEWTDNHYRTLACLISKKGVRVKEMNISVFTGCLDPLDVESLGSLSRYVRAVKSDIYVIFLIYQDRFLNLKNLAKATQLATPYGYEVINFITDTFSGLFNSCGCLNPRVAQLLQGKLYAASMQNWT
uniref:Uncharacterized protein n=1 Tax=Solanum lycopersicum TaxID=4081 RepID=A0A3Q7EIL3_SOLLC